MNIIYSILNKTLWVKPAIPAVTYTIGDFFAVGITFVIVVLILALFYWVIFNVRGD